MKRVLCVLVLSCLFFSCTTKDKIDKNNHKVTTRNGIKHIINDNIPSVEKSEVEYDFKENISISGIENNANEKTFFSRVKDIYFDKDNNIYLYPFSETGSKGEILKFDKGGNYLRRVGKKGQGPGELIYLHNYTLIDNYLCLVAFRYYNTYDLNGSFKKKNNISLFYEYNDIKFAKHAIENIQQINDTTLIGYRCFVANDENIEKKFYRFLAFLDKKDFSIKKVLRFNNGFYENKKGSNVHRRKYYYSVGKDCIYVATCNKEDYLIEVFGFDGNIKYSFSKKSIKIPYSEKEIIKIKNINDSAPHATPVFEDKYKNKINFITVDKYDRVWVNVSKDNPLGKSTPILYFDIFKDGVYLNSTSFKVDVSDEVPKDAYMVGIYTGNVGLKFFDFKGDKLFVNEIERVKIYEY